MTVRILPLNLINNLKSIHFLLQKYAFYIELYLIKQK